MVIRSAPCVHAHAHAHAYDRGLSSVGVLMMMISRNAVNVLAGPVAGALGDALYDKKRFPRGRAAVVCVGWCVRAATMLGTYRTVPCTVPCTGIPFVCYLCVCVL